MWWCLHLGREHLQLSGGVSTIVPWLRHLALMRCYLLTIQGGNERIAVRNLLYMHNSKKPNSQLCLEGCLHLLISKWHWAHKNLIPNFDWGIVSAFWWASDTESKKPKSQLWPGRVVSSFWSASNTESQKPNSQLWLGVDCLCLLISKWHWF